MHHYGEDFTRSRIIGSRFEIQCRNHVTGAVITLSGPTEGLLENGDDRVDDLFVDELGRKLVHFLRENLINPALEMEGSVE